MVTAGATLPPETISIIRSVQRILKLNVMNRLPILIKDFNYSIRPEDTETRLALGWFCLAAISIIRSVQRILKRFYGVKL